MSSLSKCIFILKYIQLSLKKKNKLYNLIVYTENEANFLINIFEDTMSRLYLQIFEKDTIYMDTQTTKRIQNVSNKIESEFKKFINLTKNLPYYFNNITKTVESVDVLEEQLNESQNKLKNNIHLIKKLDINKLEYMPSIVYDKKRILKMLNTTPSIYNEYSKICLVAQMFLNKNKRQSENVQYNYLALKESFKQFERIRSTTQQLSNIATELLYESSDVLNENINNINKLINEIINKLITIYMNNEISVILPYKMSFQQPLLKKLYYIFQFGPCVSATIKQLMKSN